MPGDAPSAPSAAPIAPPSRPTPSRSPPPTARLHSPPTHVYIVPLDVPIHRTCNARAFPNILGPGPGAAPSPAPLRPRPSPNFAPSPPPRTGDSMPRLSTIHPYPAMMPDELVTSLVRKYGGPTLLDPFCGTGRVCLAAAEAGALAFGIDVNPLALLVSRAKSNSDHADNLLDVLHDLLQARQSIVHSDLTPIDPCAGRKVEWFGSHEARQLTELVSTIDIKPRSWPTQLILATVLSATAREVSFARRDQWKLHRLSPTARAAVRQTPWNVFARRLKSAHREIATQSPLPGSCTFALADARHSPTVLRRALGHASVDTIITSPPYGDSKSTVQYGGMSSLCLDVVSRIAEFQHYRTHPAHVDRIALGGRVRLNQAAATRILHGYWAGAATNPRCRSAGTYLRDLHQSLRASAACLRPRGVFITVIARRLIGGRRLRTDEFVDDTLSALGFARIHRKRRRIAAKVTPPRINPVARNARPSRRTTVPTMREEWVLVHQAPRRTAI